MKNILIYLMSVLLCLPVFSKVTVVLAWKINQKYIIENLCINKTKPVLKCNGKCHLMGQLNESNEGSNAPVPENVKEIKLQPYYTIKLQEVLITPDINPSSKFVLSYEDNYSDRLWVSSIFVPPDNAHYLI